jgi:tetratricopeptide (TPR) repeat protein
VKRILLFALLGSAAAGCIHPGIRKDQIEELPQWRTDPRSVRIALVTELLDTSSGSANTVGALDIVRQMRAEGERDPTLDLLQGKALRIDGVTSESERLLLLARKRMPRDARPSQELCVLYADLNRVDEAIEECRRATELDASNPAAWNNLGFLLLAADRPEEALDATQAAIELDASQARYRNNLGMALAALGRDDQAFRALQTTMSRADAAFMVGIVIERYSGPDPARPWYERALKLDPNHAQARDGLAEGATEAEPDPIEAEPQPASPAPPAPTENPEPSGDGTAPPQEEP